MRTIEELAKTVSCMKTKKEKAAEFLAHMNALDAFERERTEAGIYAFHKDRLVYMEPIAALMKAHEISWADLSPLIPTTDWSIKRVPCAYLNPMNKADPECNKEGLFSCSTCRLVKYCSKECQAKHWKIHSRDCKNKRKGWKPHWVTEGRTPEYSASTDISQEGSDPLRHRLTLWGTLPAYDVLNIAQNEGTSVGSLNLMFANSGDLRNVIKTVNSLPLDFQGKTTIVLNDRDPWITVRNAVILRTLRASGDKRLLADIAYHLWYSAFIPDSYSMTYGDYIHAIGVHTGDRYDVNLGAASALHVEVTADVRALCTSLVASGHLYSSREAAVEYSIDRLRDDSHIDLHDRHYYRLRPSHRLALREYRSFGCVVPFGTHFTHYPSPNRLLFSPKGEWLQTSDADPLNSWDIEDVIEAGKAYGANEEDVYGCFYFYVTDQLVQFAERLANLRLVFKLFNSEPNALAASIVCNGKRRPLGIPKKFRFDRIDVSNMMDFDFGGVGPTLETWGGLLRNSPHACILGYFSSWPDGEPDADEASNILEELLSSGKARTFISMPPVTDDTADSNNHNAQMAWAMAAHYHVCAALYDNSEAFEAYLNEEGLEQALERNDLRRKEVRTVLPRRLGVPLDAPPSALPHFESDDSWYLKTTIGISMWNERFIEIARASS
ncbi:hypothetical protein PUNSTDRAFT_145782 [Punctularia strigosozonata HHB-11173 SS5]|uniref:uncharacterized protein n=1 Tax=Punctularia strigosozonata (strain HHB-11173) TaxID=741275 RepID=UPI00044186E7|nr:uncharacterized protein PUNSTDRAFT_145782 [Punctularia strigosozonata HHB-11173 SS5]EIN05899.1 hypothetical protein PUNSTDRAFT_145782 [Punctularia strigosozonata HHB-11173 SS5]